MVGGGNFRDRPVRAINCSAARSAAYGCALLAILPSGASRLQATEFCTNDPRVEAVDSSAPVDAKFLNQMQAMGVNTIIRYYDHEDETLPGKTLRRGERDAILMNGFKMAVVFQHRNDRLASFTPLRGHQDAERALALAAENSQPRGSA